MIFLQYTLFYLHPRDAHWGDLGSFGGELVRERTERSNRAILSISSLESFSLPRFPSHLDNVGSVRRVKYLLFFLPRSDRRTCGSNAQANAISLRRYQFSHGFLGRDN